jgi:hypothetical protein
MSEPKHPTKQPTKQDVCGWINHDVAERRPPPDLKQIRRELGWDLLQQDSQYRRERND